MMPADLDELFGAEDAAGRLTQRLVRVRPRAYGTRLSPPFALSRDHVDGPVSAPLTLVVFGAHGTPFSRSLGELLAYVREHYLTTARVAERIVDDTARALASGVAATPALFLGRERYRGELTPHAVATALERMA